MRQDVSRYIISRLLADQYQSNAQAKSKPKKSTQTQMQKPRRSSQLQRENG